MSLINSHYEPVEVISRILRIHGGTVTAKNGSKYVRLRFCVSLSVSLPDSVSVLTLLRHPPSLSLSLFISLSLSLSVTVVTVASLILYFSLSLYLSLTLSPVLLLSLRHSLSLTLSLSLSLKFDLSQALSL